MVHDYTQTLLQAPGPTTVHTPHKKQEKKLHIQYTLFSQRS